MIFETDRLIVSDLHESDQHLANFIKALTARLDDIEKETKRKRVEKVIKNLKNTEWQHLTLCISNGWQSAKCQILAKSIMQSVTIYLIYRDAQLLTIKIKRKEYAN